ncbi:MULTISPECIES: hypothetical protein [unclassified Streptomyces]|uniref:hypothetical protein n=1 Tax=unclassified Streptomyces TaxID=2593676 RepID=UPI00081F4519|nr:MULTISPECIES: hypothetical protein [unclassified Streptomyces]SCF76099.1 hypothetical protein GA0115259_102165 [Streptomyces sp. MnatMP-M17]
MMTAFGFGTPGMADVAASCVGKPDRRQCAVWDGEPIVAVGSVFINGECADMFGGATLPEGRRRGAQSALLAARARAAKATGCGGFVAETGAEGPGDRQHLTPHHAARQLRAAARAVTWLWQE